MEQRGRGCGTDRAEGEGEAIRAHSFELILQDR